MGRGQNASPIFVFGICPTILKLENESDGQELYTWLSNLGSCKSLVISVGTEWFSWHSTSLCFVLQLIPTNCAGAASLTSSLWEAVRGTLLISSVVCLISAGTSVYRRITLMLTFRVKPLISPSLCFHWLKEMLLLHSKSLWLLVC